MFSQENKLEKFEKSILIKVRKNIDKMERETEAIKESEMSKIELEQKSRSKDVIERSIVKIDEECKKEISLAEIKARKDILNIRTEITNKVFEKTKELLLEFCKTDEYKTFLKDKIKRIIDENKLGGCKIQLSNRDIVHKDFISLKIGANAEIIEDSTIILGGFKISIPDSNILIDETFENNIEDQYEKFNELYKYYLNIYKNNEVD